MPTRAAIASILRVNGGLARADADQDLVAIESPLAIELHGPAAGAPLSLGVFMRTPGDDEDLVRGTLYSEGLIQRREDVVSVAVGNYATPENRWTTAIVLGATLALFTWALFVKGLALPLPVWFR